jgi:cell division protein FtsB
VARRAQQTRASRQDAPPQKKRRRRRLRLRTTSVLLRWCVLGVLAFVGFLYYHPLSSYVETRSALNARAAEVRSLRAERTKLQARLERSSTLEALAREARMSNLVRPGERLFIVDQKQIAQWRRAQRAGGAAGATIPRDGE